MPRLFCQPLVGLLSLAAIAGSLPVQVQDSDLLLNGALEGDPIPLDWQVAAPKEGETFTVGEISQDAEAGQQGPRALKIEHLAEARYTQIRQYVDLPDTTKTYVFRGWVKTLAALPHTEGGPAAIVGVYTPGGELHRGKDPARNQRLGGVGTGFRRQRKRPGSCDALL